MSAVLGRPDRVDRADGDRLVLSAARGIGTFGAGLVIAAVKASLVVLFFMHAIHSPRVTWCVIVVSIVFLVILFSLTLADVMTRSLVPFMPGH